MIERKGTSVNLYKIFSLAFVISVSVFVFILARYLPTYLGNELSDFRLINRSIDEQKRTVQLIGLILESELSTGSGPDYSDLNISENNIYTLSDSKELTANERIAVARAKEVFAQMPGLVENSRHLLYFRSYESDTLMLARELDDYKLTPEFFTDRCKIHQTCSRYATAHSLSDRLLISPIYEDGFTGKRIITVSTPVYSKESLLGDIAMDIYLDDYSVFDGKDIVRNDNGTSIITSILESSYPLSEFSYTVEYKADNRNLFIYNVPLTKYLLNAGWIWLALFAGFLYLMWKLNELKIKQIKLENVELTVNKDELTGLYNRSILSESDFQKRIRKGNTAVIAIDGDKLKTINDTFGHHAGDEAIRHIAYGMKVTFRESDYLLRTGGDEFIAILPGCGQDSAEKLSLKLRENISSRPFSVSAGSVSVSAGVTVLAAGEKIDDAIRRADSLLYANKASKSEESKANNAGKQNEENESLNEDQIPAV